MTKARKLFLSGFILFLLLGFFFAFIEMDYLFWISLFASISLFVGMLAYDKYTAEEQRDNFINKVNDYINKNEIKIDKSQYSLTNYSNLSFSHDKGKVYLFSNSPDSFNVKIIDYTDIIESHLIENGNTITKTSRGSQVAGALIGGAIAGGVGAIIGGNGAMQTSTNTIKSLELKIVVKDLNNPVFTFSIKDEQSELASDNPIYRGLYDKAYEIHKIISLIIKQQEEKQIQ